MTWDRIREGLSRHWPLLLILMLAAVVRLLISRDMWIDEITSIVQANMSTVGGTVARVPTVHPPFYHILLHFWVGLFGISEIMVRMFSIVTGLLGVIAIYALAYRFIGPKQAIIATLFVAMSPFHIWYSQEARMYALVFLLATMSLYFFMKLLEIRKPGTWVAWGLFTALTAYAHYTGVLLAGLEILFALAYWGWGTGRLSGRKPFREWIGVTSAMVVAAIPLGIFFISKATNNVSGSLAPSTATQSFAVAMATVGEIFLGYHSKEALARLGAAWPLLIYIGPIAILGYRTIFTTKTRLLAWIAIGSLVIMAFAAYAYPLFNPRYLTIGVPALILLLACMMVRQDGRVRVWLVAVVMMLLTVAWADQTYGPKNALKYDNRAAMQYLMGSVSEDDQIIYTPPYMYLIFNYYFQTPEPRQVFAAPEPGLFESGQYRDLVPLLSRLTAGKDKVFFVYSFRDEDPRVGLVIKRVNRHLAGAYAERRFIQFRNISVICYSREGGCPTKAEAQSKFLKSKAAK